MQEFDSAIIAGRRAQLHRIAIRLLDRGRAIGDQIREFMESHLPLSSYPAAFVAILEYALIMVTERGVESIHAIIKQAGMRATFTLPPTMCATIRERANLSQLQENMKFHELCFTRWHQHNLADQILKLRVDAAKLEAMSTLEKVRTIYQCDLVGEFEDMTQAKAQQLHQQAGNPWQLALVQPPRPTKSVIRFLKCVLTANSWFSLPEVVMRSFIARMAPPGAEEFDGDCEQELLRVGDDLVPELFPDGPATALRFFCVENPTPESRFNIQPSHMRPSRSTINVSLCDLISNTGNYDKVLATRSSDIVTLDLEQLCKHLGFYLTSLFRWPVAKVHTTLKPKQYLLSVADAPQEAYHLPAILGPNAQPSQAIVPASSPSFTLDSAARYALGQLAFLNARNTEVFVNQLQDVKIDTLHDLSKLGIVTMRQSEFYEPLVSLNHDAVRLAPAFGLESCFPAFKYVHEGDQLKLPAIYHKLRLREEGWTQGEVPAEYTLGLAKLYKSQAGPISYYVALRLSGTILTKGFECIRHDGSDSYYKCLIKLKMEMVAKFIEAMDGKDDAWYRKQLKRIKDTDESDDDQREDDPVPEPLPPIEANHEFALVPVNVPERIPWRETEWQRCICTVGHTSTKVWFDNCSSVSGRRRGWANCRTHRCGCLRYVQESRNYFAVAMCLWLQHGEGNLAISKQQHLNFWPTDEDIRAAMPAATFVAF